MKIRNGFVSNSSSSSFIIDASEYTCVDVAKMMIESFFNNEWDWNENKQDKEMLIENLDKLENKNTSIYMNLYDGEQISLKDGKIYIEATRNLDWCLPCIGYGEEGEYYDLMKGDKLYFPEFDNKILGKTSYSNDIMEKYENKSIWDCKSCDNGNSRFITLDSGDVVCVACGKDPDGNDVPILKREDKLKRILKDED
jgi:hypothetical protein